MRLLSVTLALLLIIVTSSYLESAMAGPSQGFCDNKCGGESGRCSKAGKRSRCMKYCSMCCMSCGCVPSGTYGNKDECPCYRDIVWGPQKKPKCP